MCVLLVYRHWKVFQSNISTCKTFWTPLVSDQSRHKIKPSPVLPDFKLFITRAHNYTSKIISTIKWGDWAVGDLGAYFTPPNIYHISRLTSSMLRLSQTLQHDILRSTNQNRMQAHLNLFGVLVSLLLFVAVHADTNEDHYNSHHGSYTRIQRHHVNGWQNFCTNTYQTEHHLHELQCRILTFKFRVKWYSSSCKIDLKATKYKASPAIWDHQCYLPPDRGECAPP